MTEQRLGHSAVPEMSLSENILLSMNHKTDFKKGDFINFDRINSYANDVSKTSMSILPLLISKLVSFQEAIFKNL